ncbi:MAG TPA: MarR family transcriptional regulator [Lachnospiraceae bacterium]|nr:MarR family transcriptional regulator [Lachnospiraceae bacterium]
MQIEANELEKGIFDYVDKIKDVLSAEIWQNILLDCTKNELLTLWLLYRQKEVTMTQVAEYIHVPLNTATGIVSRMEKRNLLLRKRSEEDKRVVTVQLDSQGKIQIEQIMGKVLFYGKRIIEDLSGEEIALIIKIMDKVPVLLEEDQKKPKPSNKIRKISIE